MFVSIVSAVLLAVSVPLATLLPAGAAQNSRHAASIRPAVVENGSDLVLYHFMGNVSQSVTFTPDGSSWSVLPHGLLKIAPDGTNTLIFPNNRTAWAAQNIAYSNGFLWYTVYHGIIRVKPDGTDSRFFQFSMQRDGFHYASNLTPGPGGLYFSSDIRSTSYPYTLSTVIGRIDPSFKLTLFAVPPTTGFNLSSPFVSGPDGLLYFVASKSQYDPKRSLYSTLTTLYRIETNGSQTRLGSSGTCAFPKKLVVALGALYFTGSQIDTTNKLLGNALCRATLSGRIGAITPLQAGGNTSGITADASGNLWTIDLFGNGLYSYGIGTKQLAGPYEPAKLGALVNNLLYTGPDQNIWFFGSYATNQLFYGAYVRHLISFLPTSITLSATDASINFYVSEPLRSGPWTAVSSNPSIATVTPASSLPGRFTVTKVATGTTTIVVTDALGNLSYEPVTSN